MERIFVVSKVTVDPWRYNDFWSLWLYLLLFSLAQTVIEKTSSLPILLSYIETIILLPFVFSVPQSLTGCRKQS